MNTRRILAAAVAVGATLGGVAVQSGATAVEEPNRINLHNDTAGVEDDCPDDGKAYWHFVLTPNNGSLSFAKINLMVAGGLVMYDQDDIVLNGGQTDNVFVEVPATKSFDDLETSGSYALLEQDVAPAKSKFVLSHVCPGGDEPEPQTPVVTIDKTAVVTHEYTYTWDVLKEVDPEYEVVFGDGPPYVLFDYTVTPTKLDGPDDLIVIDGSYVVSGTITVNVSGEGVVVTDVDDELVGADCVLVDEPDWGAEGPTGESGAAWQIDYTCTQPGVPTGTDLNVATVDFTVGLQDVTLSGTAPVDYDASVGTMIENPFTLDDDRYDGELANDGEPVTYTMRVYPTPDCLFTNTVTLDADYGPDPFDDVTVSVCSSTGGHTIGFWFASPHGSEQTAARLGELKEQFARLLGDVPDLQAGKAKGKKAADDSTASFLAAANCSGDCRSMLQAQFIATAMSALVDGTGDQCVLVPMGIDPDGEATIAELLDRVNELSGVSPEINAYLAGILDSINNNVAIACSPSVV